MSLWSSLLGQLRPAATPHRRASAAEVEAAARATLAAAGAPGDLPLAVAAPERRAAGLTWVVRSATKGQVWIVEIEDATLAAGPARRIGVR